MTEENNQNVNMNPSETVNNENCQIDSQVQPQQPVSEPPKQEDQNQ